MASTAALTFKILTERLSVTDKPKISDHIDDYVKSQDRLRLMSNPSGGHWSGGLGEPKFYPNGTAFTGAWNRPQQDGPALRATALIIYAKHLLAEEEGTKYPSFYQSRVNFQIWPIIMDDLRHIARYWNHTSFDLWEETNGSSFFTLSASHRALVEGMALAKTLDRRCDGCASAAPQILCFMETFWGINYMHANINSKDQRSGIDASSILSSIHAYDPQAGCTNSTFQPCSSRALANHKTVTDAFRPLYGINSGIKQGQGVAIGRYPEDDDHGGNPWYMTTLAAAEQLYLAVLQWLDQGQLIVDETSLPFFQDLLPKTHVGTYGSGGPYKFGDDKDFKSIVSTVRDYADSYMAIVQKYIPLDGGLPQQFDKTNGMAVSAANFTWSHAAFYTAANRYLGVKGPSWGEPQNNTFELSQCYCHARVTFHVRSDPNNVLFVVGDVPELGNGETKDARMLTREFSLASIASKSANYSAQIDVPALTRIEYHYYMVNGGAPEEEEWNKYRYIKTGDCGSNVDTSLDTFFY
ncbi:uncharacterized protein J4E92_007919 [Alternaria infectoria]|uniref:uncharacterized protein n=1 Tax=Alternaria infectoria TaxID=45303 RepID=UPI00221F1CC7|nr:uncharacterized protein J4E92_007919 [Alternaria infectoria]KAI4923165.1 hypothetical protein J4E92_007919 [Alternaria infectoria]